jgi:hypothetical protein
MYIATSREFFLVNFKLIVMKMTIICSAFVNIANSTVGDLTWWSAKLCVINERANVSRFELQVAAHQLHPIIWEETVEKTALFLLFAARPID